MTQGQGILLLGKASGHVPTSSLVRIPRVVRNREMMKRETKITVHKNIK